MHDPDQDPTNSDTRATEAQPYNPRDPNDWRNHARGPDGAIRPDEARAHLPNKTIQETDDSEPRDPDNTVVELANGRKIEVPPSSLTAAKDALAAQRAAEREVGIDGDAGDERDNSQDGEDK